MRVQILRPRLGHGSDVGGRRTPWIIGGMAMLARGRRRSPRWRSRCSMQLPRWAASRCRSLAFMLIGVGVGAAGTSLLVLLAKRVDERRRAAAATVVWLMMIAGFVVTTIVVGQVARSLLRGAPAGR